MSTELGFRALGVGFGVQVIAGISEHSLGLPAPLLSMPPSPAPSARTFNSQRMCTAACRVWLVHTRGNTYSRAHAPFPFPETLKP